MPEAEARSRPASPAQLFLAFNRMALQGFGGVLPVAQHVLVESERWLDQETFVETLALAQVLPGPNVVNMALMLGDRWFGWRGAAAAAGGLLLAPLVIVLALAALYGQFAQVPVVAGALRGMGAVASGLVIATAWRLWPALARSPLGRIPAALFAGATLLSIGALRWPLVAVLLGLGAVAVAWAWHRTAR